MRERRKMERKPILRKFDHITPLHFQLTTEMNFDVQGHVMHTTKNTKVEMHFVAFLYFQLTSQIR